MLLPFMGVVPRLGTGVFVADGAKIVGDVEIGACSSIWFNAVLRGDLAPIIIGKESNIQDGVVGHVNRDQPLIIEDGVSVGHSAIVHGCRIGKGTLIGMGAIVLSGAEIGEYALVGAGSLITERQVIPPYTLCLGSPAKVVRELTERDLEQLKRTADSYVTKGKQYLSL
ncbi:gamma carbonic anhydrase family protein [Cohnella faecalis]|uniref:Gamma carbonic anhydrase family protein n=2 Tax=Cohnella faecalis TaxID=2315694 RepID=A0A398CMT1_9BACL|nr:gamma carbonic anhydrase family protein [Cohnella faecalis]RIE04666.1 gamma carbonic anhydrase family protein [Cohnella faecalis]